MPSPSGKVWADGDFDDDGDVDGVDLAALGLNWSPGGYVAAPEPATVALIAAGLAGVFVARKNKKLQR